MQQSIVTRVGLNIEQSQYLQNANLIRTGQGWQFLNWNPLATTHIERQHSVATTPIERQYQNTNE
jgi:hypothetical protein